MLWCSAQYCDAQVLLALDELCDSGILLESDPQACSQTQQGQHSLLL